MKRLIVLLIYVLFSGCTENVNQPNETSSNIGMQTLSATLVNYNNSDSILIKLEQEYTISPTGKTLSVIAIDSTVVNRNGYFKLSLSKPSDKLLNYKRGLQSPGLIFGNETTKMYTTNILWLYKNNEKIGYAFCANNERFLRSSGDYVVSLIYSCDTLSVHGNANNGGYKQSINKIDYHLKKGWNLAIRTVDNITDSTVVLRSIIDNEFNGYWDYKISI